MYPRTSIAVVVLLVLVGAMPLQAQTLADVARKADAQKKTAKGTKTYTNKDVGDVPPATSGPLGTTSTDSKPADAGQTPPKDGAATTPATSSTTPASGAGVKDQAYYAGKMKELRGKLDRDQSFLSALQSQINALNTDFVNRDDPAQRSQIEQSRNKALAQRAQLQKDIADDKKAIADFEEEARKAGAPPGWLR